MSAIRHDKNIKNFRKVRFQYDFLSAYFRNQFNLSKTCREFNLPTSSYYYAVDNVPEFRQKMLISNNILKTTVSSSLMRGLLHEDVNVRKEYIKVIPDRLLDELLSGNSAENNENVEINLG